MHRLRLGGHVDDSDGSVDAVSTRQATRRRWLACAMERDAFHRDVACSDGARVRWTAHQGCHFRADIALGREGHCPGMGVPRQHESRLTHAKGRLWAPEYYVHVLRSEG